MKITSLLQEGITAASSPENATNSAPTMGRSDKFLESENTDMTGKTCEKCKKGEYQETGVQDDMHGVLHCTKCGNETKRWKNYKEQVSETTAGATGSGSVASVSAPMGKMQRRGKGSIFSGIKTSEKFPNSKAVKESVNPQNFDSDVDYYDAVKKQGQQQFSGDWDVYDEIASLENQIKYSKSSALAHTLYQKIDQLKQQAGIEDDEDEYEKEYDADIRARKGMAEGEEMSTFAALKDWRVWDVHVYNNFYRGKYADYGPRLYSVVASSPEEAREVVINNPDYVLQDLLSRKLVSGKKVLPRGSALPIEAKRVGKAEPGTITTMAFKKMLTPDGVQSFKFSGGKIVDGAYVQGGEEVEEGMSENRGYFDGMPTSDNDYFRIPGPDAKPATSYSSPARLEQQPSKPAKYSVGDIVPVYMGSSPGVATINPSQIIKGKILEVDPTGHMYVYKIKLEDGKIASVGDKRINVARATLKKQGVEEGLGGDMAKLIGIPVVAGAAAIGAQHYDDQQPHVQVGGQNAKIVQYGSSRIPDSAMLLKGQDGKMYRVWQQSGKGMNKITLASPAEPVKEQELDEKSVSKAQFRTMAAVAHNPKFAKKVGISQKVGKEFHKADKKSDYSKLPKKVDEAEIAEDVLAQNLYQDLQIFKKGAAKDISTKATDKEISGKAKDKEIIAKVTKK